MPMQPTNPRLLLIVKQFFTEGKTLAAYGDNLAGMKAILFLDLAIEQMLNIMIADFGSGDNPVRDNIKWPQLWEQAVCAVKDANVMSGIPHYKELKTLREVRNLVQHRGVIPNPADVSRFILSVEAMLTACFHEPYRLSFETFQLWDAICNSDLRRLISECQQALELGDPTMALAGTRVAFDEIVGAVEENAAGGRARDRLSPSRTHIRVAHTYREGGLNEVAEVASQVARLIDELSETFSSELNYPRL